MSRFVVLSVLFILPLAGFSQNWQDSLETARKLYKNQKYDAALKKYKATKKIAPKKIDLSEEMGQTAYKARKFEEAEKYYKESSSRYGNSAQKAKLHRNLGNAYMQQKKYTEAVESYKESLRNEPDNDQTRKNLVLAMKKHKEQQNQNQQNQNQNQQNQNQQNQNQQNQQNQNQKQQNQNQNQQNQQSQSQSGQGQQKQGQQGQKPKLSNKMTERMLDDLVKKEMETKKKFGNNKSTTSGNKSGKDW